MHAVKRENPAGRPAGRVIGFQRWHELLFLHFAVAPALLRPLVDPRLDLDLFDGQAFVSLTPFTVRGARLRGLPPLPGLTAFHELNCRTYVHRRGTAPGIWFFSLDAASAPAAALARLSVQLPYFRARIERRSRGDAHEYESVRLRPRASEASLRTDWTAGASMGTAAPGSREHFLAERYVYYSRGIGGRLLLGRVFHPPWPLRVAVVTRLEQTVTRAAGIAAIEAPALVQFSDGVDVEFFAPALAAPAA